MDERCRRRSPTHRRHLNLRELVQAARVLKLAVEAISVIVWIIQTLPSLF
jgi:hypothetical protein